MSELGRHGWAQRWRVVGGWAAARVCPCHAAMEGPRWPLLVGIAHQGAAGGVGVEGAEET